MSVKGKSLEITFLKKKSNIMRKVKSVGGIKLIFYFLVWVKPQQKGKEAQKEAKSALTSDPFHSREILWSIFVNELHSKA